MADSGPEPGANAEQIMLQLRKTFDQLPRDIDLYLFTDRGGDDYFSGAIRQVVRSFREITDKITFREHYLDHDLAQKWGVEHSPSLLIAPDHVSIRWLGAPVGEEARMFLEALILVGQGSSGLSEQSLGVAKKIDEKRTVKVFVSPTCPYCPQQAINAVKAAVEMPDLISLEIVDIQANPEMANQYGAMSVPQTFADDILIGQGAQTEELFMLSLQKMEPQTVFIPDNDAPLVEADVVIVGGGPAGLTAGIYAIRSGLKAVVIERGALGGQVATTPVVENYPGFTQVAGKTLVDIMVSHALEYVPIFQGEEVVSIQPGQPILVSTSRRKFHTRSVLLATGATHKQLGVPGEARLSGRGVSYCSTCDGPLFKGKNVVMIGGGNSAVTEALHLHHMGVSVTLIHRRDTLRAQDMLVKNIEDNDIPVLWNTEVKEIQGTDRVEAIQVVNNQTRETTLQPTDGVFLAIGYTPTVALATKLGVALTPEGYIQRDEKHRTNIPGIYTAGDVEGGYKQIVTAAGQGSEAALAIFEDLINPYWQNEGK
ncbi:MAG: FAD-dependent oxidoreductase [Desulfobacterales bacterium]